MRGPAGRALRELAVALLRDPATLASVDVAAAIPLQAWTYEDAPLMTRLQSALRLAFPVLLLGLVAISWWRVEEVLSARPGDT